MDNNFDMSEERIDARGGTANGRDDYTYVGCGNGGAGTIWFKTSDRLIIDNKNVETARFTLLNPPSGS